MGAAPFEFQPAGATHLRPPAVSASSIAAVQRNKNAERIPTILDDGQFATAVRAGVRQTGCPATVVSSRETLSFAPMPCERQKPPGNSRRKEPCNGWRGFAG